MGKVVLVDEQDKSLGLKDKIEAHLGEGNLHRAFTIFVFNSRGETLLAQRSANKMLWPSIWDSACASHPEEDESYASAGERRLAEELSFTCKLKNVDQFRYYEKYLDVGSENELCVTLIGEYDGAVNPNPEEVSGFKWLNVDDLKVAIEKHPTDYAIWLKIAFQRLLDKSPITAEGLK